MGLLSSQGNCFSAVPNASWDFYENLDILLVFDLATENADLADYLDFTEATLFLSSSSIFEFKDKRERISLISRFFF